MGRFEGRVALVTGGARNIGLACVRAFHEAGARVVVADKREEAARETADALGGRAMAVGVDVSDEASVGAMMARVGAEWGRLDALVNNAGIATLNLARDLTVAEWDAVLGVNLRGPWLCVKHALPLMEAGAVVNIASQAAQRAQKFTAHYSASKMGVIGLTRALAVELAPRIRVNAVSPGTIDNDLIQQEVDWRVARGHDADGAAVRDDWLRRIPMGRFQPPEAVARAVLWLASDDASETTGETLNVSGGAVMV
jgi:NAD(P)-dependent dehydrogenase (short-subunit alcohol dehydrogenase family)